MPLQGGMPPPQVAESAKDEIGNDDDAVSVFSKLK
jgi:hypothetical protein